MEDLENSEFKPFWIDWTNRTLMVGKAEAVGVTQITNYTWKSSIVGAIVIRWHGNAAVELKIGEQRVGTQGEDQEPKSGLFIC